ncbi:MAG: S16 family serine protease [Rhizomicrobium sp.]
MKAHGLKDDEWRITDAGLKDLIRYHTREAGVRSLEREIANLARKAVKEIVSHKATSVVVDETNVDTYAGVRKVPLWRGRGRGSGRRRDRPGLDRGRRRHAADRVRHVARQGPHADHRQARRRDEGVDRRGAVLCPAPRRPASASSRPLFDKIDIHVHVPEGATPKDGPSAGLAMATSIISVITGIPVRRDVAMTGEVTLRGRALPIGGLKEKLLAALRAGIKTVIIPQEEREGPGRSPGQCEVRHDHRPGRQCR